MRPILLRTALTAAVAVGLAAAPAAHATPTNPTTGRIVTTAPLPTPLAALSTTRLLTLTTRDSRERPRTMTASLFTPTSPWRGPGRRPLVAMAIGTYGQGDRCAPSYGFTTPVAVSPGGAQVGYEASGVALLLARGYSVVVPDYIGMRDPGVHTYLNRVDQGRAVLDATRAARSLLGPGPVGFWGYSQGGYSVGAAAELLPGYAPELPLRAVYSGGPVGDVAAALRNRGSIMALPVLGWTVNSAMASDPALRGPIAAALTADGRSFLRRIADMCLPDAAAAFGIAPAGRLTVDGRPPVETLLAIPGFRTWVDAQRLGRVAPQVPVLIHAGRHDDVSRFAGQARLARDWRSRGASVRLLVFEAPATIPGLGIDHSLPHQLDNERALAWFTANLLR